MPATAANLRVSELRDRALLKVSGPDAASFLQGQFSNDLRRLSTTRGQFSSYNSPKGRLLAVLHLMKHGDDILLQVHASLAERLVQRLRMFVLRAKVKISPAEDLDGLGLIGPGAAEQLRALQLPVPEAVYDTAGDPLIVMRAYGDTPRYAVVGPREAIGALRARLPEASETDWHREDLLAGVPMIYPQTQDQFVPQHADLDRLGALSFDKGCYTGQEVVARLHYLGAVKRRLCRFASSARPEPGSALRDLDGRAVGDIVDGLADAEGQYLGLAVVQAGHLHASELRLDAPADAGLSALHRYVPA